MLIIRKKVQYFCPLSCVHTIASSTPLPLQKGAKAWPLREQNNKKTTTPPYAFLYSNYTKQQGNALPLGQRCSSQALSEDQKKMQAGQSGTGAFHSSFTRPGHSISKNTSVGLQESQGLLQFGFEIKSNLLYITSIVHIILLWSCVKLLGVGLPVTLAYI